MYQSLKYLCRKRHKPIEDKALGDLKTSPLAPESFPAMPPVAGAMLATAEAGVRYAGRTDVLLATFDPGTTIAGVFTQSTMPGAPVVWCKQALADSQGQVRALVVKAGNANVFTAQDGRNACDTIAAVTSDLVGCNPSDVMLSATGVIGEKLPVDKVTAVLPSMVPVADGWADAALAIMTTDTFPKGATRQAQIGGTTVTINGIAKGSGMIEPDMATMLAYVVTDASLPANVLDALLRKTSDGSFNAITVDSDTSTSDTVLLMATGAAGHAVINDPSDPALAVFTKALQSLMTDLAQQVVRDGEGASKFITVEVTGAQNDAAAKKVAKSIANSPLVKTAIAGEDANWGRVVMAVGKCGEQADPDKLLVNFGGQPVTENGKVREGYDESALDAHLTGSEIDLQVDLGVGSGRAIVWTCDLTHGYIDINADYRS
jgi:glutamate N-acetyltransferase/amino-acid N-acetyltransferase